MAATFEADRVFGNLRELEAYLTEYSRMHGGAFEIVLVDDQDVTENSGYNLVVRAHKQAELTRVRLAPLGGSTWNILLDLLRKRFDARRILSTMDASKKASDALKYHDGIVVFEMRESVVKAVRFLPGESAP
jgi:hypothetical protein